MRHKKMGLGLAVLVVLLSAVLGATVLREPIAYAATPFQSVLVANTDAQPIPVKQQGTAPVAQQAVTGGGGVEVDLSDGQADTLASPVTASAMIVRFNGGNQGVLRFFYQGNPVLTVPNGAFFDDTAPGSDVHVPLTLPVKFDELRCVIQDGSEFASCAVFYAGATP